MDFKRIILMLTFFFFIFDAYLAYRVYEQYEQTAIRQSDYQQQSIEQRLTDRGISLISNLDSEKISGHLIKSEDNRRLSDQMDQLKNQSAEITEENQLVSTFDTPLPMELQITNSMNALTPEIASYIRDTYLLNNELFINGEAYTQYWYLPSLKTIIFWTTAHNDAPIIDGTSEIRLQLNEDYDIESYTQTLQEDFVVLEEDKPQPLISARDAIGVLDTRIQTNLPSNSTIIHVTLSYVKYKEWEDVNVYLPVWNVVYQKSDGQTGSMWVDAIRGEVVERPKS